MPLIRSESIENLTVPIGSAVELESLRQAVVPPYLMLMPFVKVPDWIVIEDQLSLDEDGVHGCIYVLEATRAGEGEIEVGFQDLQTNQITHRKVISITTP